MSASPQATLIGGHGFVGRHLQTALTQSGWQYRVCGKNDPIPQKEDLGHVFYCAGLTANFRQHPFATVEAHVSLLSQVLQCCTFTSLTYLSSTRVYSGAESTRENATLHVRSDVPGDLYNLSKLMGESLCLASQRPVRIVRLSNVYGTQMPAQNFLAEILRDSAKTGRVLFRSARQSQKDYISVQDVVRYLPLIALNGSQSIYNLASGSNMTHASIAGFLEAQGIGCEFIADAPELTFPVIDTCKLFTEFGVAQHGLEKDLPALFSFYREES